MSFPKFTIGYAINKVHILQSLNKPVNNNHMQAIHIVLSKILKKCGVIVPDLGYKRSLIIILKNNYNYTVSCFNTEAFIEHSLLENSDDFQTILNIKYFIHCYNIWKLLPKNYSNIDYKDVVKSL